MESDAVAARQTFAEGRYEEARKLLPRYLRDEEKLLGQLVKTGDAGRALRALNPQMALFYMNAYQSYLFNKVMAQRGMEMIDRLMEGDLAYIHAKGAVFSVKDAAAEGPRAESIEISPSGPIYGKKLLFASGKEGEIEKDMLAKEGLTMELFDEKRLGRLSGERRPFRVPVKVEGAVEEPEAGMLVVRFSLPAGAYATNVLREVMKNTELEEDE
jgi:tRNA pseudouridine13 synthase